MADKSSYSHPDQGRIVRQIIRPTKEAVAALAECLPAFVLDRMGKHGAMSNRILPLSSGMRLCGPAITCMGPDVSVRRMAIDLAEPGDVLVIAAGGVEDRACFGEYTARQMAARGIAGIVIDGGTRDALDIRRLGFPTFVRSVTPRNFAYPVAERGAINVDVICGGAKVSPGDLVIADDDGVIVVPRLTAEALAQTIVDELRQDTEKRRKDLDKKFGLEADMAARGYRFE